MLIFIGRQKIGILGESALSDSTVVLINSRWLFYMLGWGQWVSAKYF